MKKMLIALLLALSANTYGMSNLSCLAENIYREARGEPFIGKLAVANVTLNRVKHPDYPKSICKVVFQPYQFSWTTDFKKPEADKESYAIARMAINGYTINKFDAIYFHAKYVKPHWRNTVKVATIGNHIFYKEKL
jgi:spore germination cell wall hydrolase CwlJ-like protein